LHDFLHKQFKERTTIKSELYLNRYLKFCLSYTKSDIDDSTLCHIHHILPKSIFPEYQKLNENQFNSCRLPVRAHLIAHYMLGKAIGGSMWYAFNFMNNFNHRMNSRLYEHAMREFSNYNSKNKKGKITAFEPMTMKYIGLVQADDPRFETGEICGNHKKHFCEDDHKYNHFFRIASRPKDKIEVHDKKSRLTFLMYEDDWRIKVGLYGLVNKIKSNEERERISKKMKVIQKGKVTVYDRILKKNVRIDKSEFDGTRHSGIGTRIYRITDTENKEYVMDKKSIKEFCKENKLSFDCFMSHVGKGEIEKSRYTHKKYQSRINTSGWMIEELEQIGVNKS